MFAKSPCVFDLFLSAASHDLLIMFFVVKHVRAGVHLHSHVAAFGVLSSSDVTRTVLVVSLC